MAGEDEIEGGNRSEEQIHYSSANLSSDWPFNGLANTSMSMVTSRNTTKSTSCSSTSMIDSFCHTGPTIWDHHPANSRNLGAFSDMNNLQNNPTTSSSSLGFRKRNLLVPPRNLDTCCPPPNSIKRGGMFLPPSAASTMIPHTLSEFPADSSFIERAARLSSFSAGNFEDIINPFANVPESSLSPYSSRPIQGQPQEGFAGSGLKSASGEGSKDIPLPVDCGADEAKQSGSGFSGNNVTGEAQYSEGGGGQDENSNEGFVTKKRRSDQDTEYNQEARKNNTEIQQKCDNNPKHGKQVSQSSDVQKEEYIHVRARRGQATNSHSLAERVRREKISERMKFLQDLVPGCSKVTGKAVMLDEIINYVQSLQRQVEFLSMKLATVNPGMDLNLEGLLAKTDITMSYTPDRSQMAIMQGAGYKDHTSQVPSSWADELHDIVQMGLNPKFRIHTSRSSES